MSDYLSFSLEGENATITLDDGKANAWGFGMMADLSEAIAQGQSEAKTITIRGRPNMTCAGFDLKVMKNEPERVVSLVDTGARLLCQMLSCPKPIIIASTGHAMAAGALMMLAGDMRIGLAGDYKYGLNETAIGMTMPDFGLDLAVHRLGMHNMSMAVLSAKLYDPVTATQIGYLDRVVEPNDFETSLAEAIDYFQSLDARAYAGTKRKIHKPLVDKILAGLNPDDLNISA